MKKSLLIFTFSVVFFAQSVFGCSLVVKGLSEFDEEEFIFIGEVVGFTQPVKSKELRQKAVGIIIKKKEEVYLPQNTKNHFEIFLYSLWADCSYAGKDIDELERLFRVGAEVRVIAKIAKHIPQTDIKGNLRLEIVPGERGSIASNTDENGKRLTDSKSIYGYENFSDPKFDEFGESRKSAYEAINSLPDFEARKELLRLKNTENQEQKIKILDRLITIAKYKNTRIYVEYEDLFKKYIPTKDGSEKYYRLYLKITSDDETYRSETLYRDIYFELMKQGFVEKIAEWSSIAAVFDEKNNLSHQETLNRSIEFAKVYSQVYKKLRTAKFKEDEIEEFLLSPSLKFADSLLKDFDKFTVETMFQAVVKKIEEERIRDKIYVDVQEQMKRLGYDEETRFVIIGVASHRINQELSKEKLLNKVREFLDVYEFVSSNLVKQGFKKERIKGYLLGKIVNYPQISKEEIIKRVKRDLIK